ncbi:alpha/beta fold hydrolase [Dactylosporangium sp. CA-139114]|uniref:alpha/beta fold hydrolase n=1 Tax=Dactylosporangium sp. CA-139114 TaxID=3239931 RepID=UPI003D988C35
MTVRGTLRLYPGRGEHPGVYERFARRLAFDGYQLGDGDQAPLVLVGSDTGALAALAAAPALPVAGVIAVGTPWAPAPVAPVLRWADELAARTACPAHRDRLEGDAGFARGALSTPVPPELAAAVDPVKIEVPVLLLHGAADPVAPLAGARALAARLPRAELAVVRDGRHDVLNDAPHRTVAAHVVQWLERLRADPAAAPILAVA